MHSHPRFHLPPPCTLLNKSSYSCCHSASFSLLNALSHSCIPDYIFFIDALSLMNPPIPATIPLSPSSTCFPIPAITLLFLLDMLTPRLHLLNQCVLTNKLSYFYQSSTLPPRHARIPDALHFPCRCVLHGELSYSCLTLPFSSTCSHP